MIAEHAGEEAIAAKSLQHFCLVVPDRALGRKSYEDFGLEVEDQADRLALRCAGWDQDQIVLVEGARLQLHHISLGTDTAGLETPKAALEDSLYVWGPDVPEGVPTHFEEPAQPPARRKSWPN